MSSNDRTQGSIRQSMKRRDFLQRAGWGSVGVTGLIIGSKSLTGPGSPALALSLLDPAKR